MSAYFESKLLRIDGISSLMILFPISMPLKAHKSTLTPWCLLWLYHPWIKAYLDSELTKRL